jgi:hypothetical protein
VADDFDAFFDVALGLTPEDAQVIVDAIKIYTAGIRLVVWPDPDAIGACRVRCLFDPDLMIVSRRSASSFVGGLISQRMASTLAAALRRSKQLEQEIYCLTACPLDGDGEEDTL